MLRRQTIWNYRNISSRKYRKTILRRSKRARLFRSTLLGIEWLEDRVVLAANPILSVVVDQVVDEGAPLSITNIGTFTDVVEATAPEIGLDPADFPSLGIFDPSSNVTINTDTLTISGGFSGVGETESANVGHGPFDIAVFTFSSFELDAGRTITAFGSRPLALLSKSGMTIAGIINGSATSDGDIFNGERIAGPGGGNGGEGDGGVPNPPGFVPDPEDGHPAAGAPANSVGKWEITTASTKGGGTGGAFGGDGGRARRSTGSESALGTEGQSFGDLSIAIQGGSGGATAGNANLLGTGGLNGGGGGGGGIELGAVGTLVITGQVLANGGDGIGNPAEPSNVGGGGGGAGGGILVHATTVDIGGALNVAAVLSANGGNGGPAPCEGGGGGGGRILIAGASVDTTGSSGTITVTAGDNGPEVGGNGQDGTIDIVNTSIPLPIIESFTYFINWGDSPLNDTGSATIDVPGVNIGNIVQGSFDGSHTYSDDGLFQVVVRLADSSMSGNFVTGIAGVDFVEATFDVLVNNVAPTLVISGDSSVDEGATYTLNLSESDPGADTITSWTITWGDGTQIVTGNPSSVTHTYAAGGATHAVSATATDEDGTFTSNTLNVTVNDVVVVPSVGTFLVGSVLNVIGSTTGNNTATISQSNGTITINGSFNTPNSVSFSASSCTEIVVEMGDGSDIVIASSSITVPMTIHAGGGNDLITTGNGDDLVFGGPGIDILYGQGGEDVLLGGTGNDDLLGGNGNDVLIGGNGMDMLFGGNGRDLLIGSANEDLLSSGNDDDILIGGSTVYDDYDTLAKQDAIDDIMDIWTSTDGFTTRVGDLNLSGLLQTNSKVFDDDAMDLIIGGAGRDLVFGDNSPVGDGVSDLISLIPLQDQLEALT